MNNNPNNPTCVDPFHSKNNVHQAQACDLRQTPLTSIFRNMRFSISSILPKSKILSF